ncbi:MAG TPA: heparinase II/III family protein [Planctomycetota bacterium]|nr:heparinase II/III family protein [Planctomycetota bacterium]
MKLANHPRLFISSQHYDEVRKPTDHPQLAAAQKETTRRADAALASLKIDVDQTSHNWHLIRARIMQGHALSLLAEYKRTGERKYREGVIKCVDEMCRWEYWSWIAWRENKPAPDAIFDLSYGENSMTLALLFDALQPELSEQERALFVDTARKRSLQPYLARNDNQKPEWWYTKPDTNWNTVCNGGAGMLALAMYELCPEAPRVLELAEGGVVPYFEFLKGEGAWPEGIGYWNYGMRYGYAYLLSHERATGKKHPLLERPLSEKTLLFPLALTPNGVPCSFGDVNTFSPLPFHYAAAERYGRFDIIAELDRRGANLGDTHWPNAAELVLLHPRTRMQQPKDATPWRKLVLMEKLEWGYVADAMPNPSIYASIRGGTTKAPHTHDDLMSFFCVVKDEALIDNVGVDAYHDTTFSPRRFELYEASANSKNTIFVNGVSIGRDATVATTLIEKPDYKGFRIDATKAMGISRGSEPAVSFCGRALLLVKDSVILVIDRVETPFAALSESRLHTFSKVEFAELSAKITGKRNSLHVAFAASQPGILRRGMGTPTEGTTEPDTMLRLCSKDKQKAITIAYLLTPNGNGTVSLKEEGERTIVSIDGVMKATIEFKTAGFQF